MKTLDSLLQWDPSTILTNSSSRYIIIQYSGHSHAMFMLLGYRIVESFERVTSQYAQNIQINSMINFSNPTVSVMAENVRLFKFCTLLLKIVWLIQYQYHRCLLRFFNKKGEIWPLVS